jgi:glyoxylase-like metal-dependent hydrolase (beta-lactamase superfamily II)
MQQIKRGILYEDAYLGVTIGALVYPFGVILIDAPLRPEDARSWRSVLLNQRGGPNRLLVSLDAHPDRTLGVRALDVTVIAHQSTAQVFRTRPTIFKGNSTESGSNWEAYDEAVGTRWVTPDITFTDRLTLNWGGPEVVVEYHGGPMPGAAWVIIPADQVVFVGDCVVLNQPPFLANAELEPWIESLALLKRDYQNYTIVSGRGGPVPAAAIQEQQHFLKNVLKGIERLAKKDAPPEASAGLIPSLLKGLSYPPELEEQYTQRLRFGLFQYYARRFHPASAQEQMAPESPES